MNVVRSNDRQPLVWYGLWLTIGWSLIGLVVYFSLTPSPPDTSAVRFGDKIGHSLAYFLLMAWFVQLYRPSRYGLLLGAFVFMGVFLECLQAQTDYRTFDYVDMIANSLGVAVGWGLAKTPLSTSLLKLERQLRLA